MIITFNVLLNILNNFVLKYIKITNIKTALGFKNTIENNFLVSGNMIARENKIVSVISNNLLRMFSGLLILYIKRSAVYAVTITAMVDVWLCDKLNILAMKTSNNMFITVVIPLGIALLITFMKNFPLTISWFGSSAKINAGTPIVRLLINDIWIGIKGYV